MILNYERYQFKSHKKQKKYFTIVIFCFIFLTTIFAFFFFTNTGQKIKSVEDNIDLNQDLVTLWEKRNYDEIINISDHNLLQNPLEPYYLIYRGFSYFHKGKEIYDSLLNLFGQYFKLDNREFDLNEYIPIASEQKDKLLKLIQAIQSIYDKNQLKDYIFFKEFSENTNNIDRFTFFIKGCISLFDESIISLRRALLLEQVKIKHQVYYILGKSYFHKGKECYDLSIKYLKLASEMGYKKLDLYEYLAIVYEEVGQIEKAVLFFETAYKEKPIDLYLLYLAKYSAMLKQYEKAEEYINNIISKTKDNELLIESRLLLGSIYFDKKEYVKAKELYDQILNGSSESDKAHYQLALVFEKLGDYAKYRSELRKAYMLNPKNEDARHRLYD